MKYCWPQMVHSVEKGYGDTVLEAYKTIQAGGLCSNGEQETDYRCAMHPSSHCCYLTVRNVFLVTN